MTYEEAIMYLNDIETDVVYHITTAEKKAIEIAIKALEKQIPKKVNVTYQANTGKPIMFNCPYCGTNVIGSGFYCHCGQHLDWSE